MKLLLGFAVLVMLVTDARCQDSPKFWTKERKFETAAAAALISVDGWTTSTLNDRGFREINPVARGYPPPVSAALGFGVTIGSQYLLHRLHHDKAAIWVGRVIIGAEAANIARQGYMVSEGK